MEDAFQFSEVSSLKANITWKNISDLKIEIIEHGSEDVADDYSQRLGKSGERNLGAYFYQLDSKTNKFFRRADGGGAQR